MSEQCPNCGYEAEETVTGMLMLHAVREFVDAGLSDEAIMESAKSTLEFCRDFDRRVAELERKEEYRAVIEPDPLLKEVGEANERIVDPAERERVVPSRPCK